MTIRKAVFIIFCSFFMFVGWSSLLLAKDPILVWVFQDGGSEAQDVRYLKTRLAGQQRFKAFIFSYRSSDGAYGLNYNPLSQNFEPMNIESLQSFDKYLEAALQSVHEIYRSRFNRYVLVLELAASLDAVSTHLETIKNVGIATGMYFDLLVIRGEFSLPEHVADFVRLPNVGALLVVSRDKSPLMYQQMVEHFSEKSFLTSLLKGLREKYGEQLIAVKSLTRGERLIKVLPYYLPLGLIIGLMVYFLFRKRNIDKRA